MGAQESQQDKTYKYHRRSTRLPKHDYTWSRGYFVTIRTSTHDPLFEVPQLHAILRETWEALPQRFPGVTLDAFVIMPDHVHFILWLNGLVEHAPTLGMVVGAYKSLVMKAWIENSKSLQVQHGGSFWQRGFIDVVIDNKEELERIRHYIKNNPEKLATREF